MNAQPITITAEQQAEWVRYAEKGLHIIQRERAENRRLRTAHADVLAEIPSLRDALARGDAREAALILDVVEKYAATHAFDMRATALPPGVIDLLEVRERCEGEPITGGAA